MEFKIENGEYKENTNIKNPSQDFLFASIFFFQKNTRDAVFPKRRRAE